MKKINKVIFCTCLIGIFFSCGRNEKIYLNDLNQNILELDSLRQYIEIRHNTEIYGYLTNRLVFVNSRNKKPRYKSDIYDDEVMLRMKKLNIREIRFEKKKNNLLEEVYFEREKFFYYPVVSYLYEYDGTTKNFESKTIYYKPVNKHWSLYIDSNYP
jgi:hypothetical protein